MKRLLGLEGLAALAVTLFSADASVAQSLAPPTLGAPPGTTSANTASPATVSQQPVIGPAPAWVTPMAIPATQAPGGGDAPVSLMLSDQQVFLEGQAQTTYAEYAMKIQTPAGLAAGNISLPWRPDTDVLTVHKLQIHRGDQVIDVLASGQTFTVIRREQNLENAVLDGVLTANIQPEGLQVGDILDVAFSVRSADPVLAGHAETFGGAWDSTPIGRAHLSVQWPASLHITAHETALLPPVRLDRRGNVMRFDLSMDNPQPIVRPSGAPRRFAIMRLAEFTSFSSWADLGALVAPLYVNAAKLPADGPLRAEVTRIRDASPDPIIRTQAALALVQDHIRYVALAMGEGGLVPADAATTWSRRFGDCKAKTALLLAILHELSIDAEPIAVSTAFGDGLDQRLPTVGLFNHVLVRATIAGKTYWLDGTRSGDSSLAALQTPDFGWGVPLVAQNAALVRIQPDPLATPQEKTTIRIDASGGLIAPAPIHVEVVESGDIAVVGNIYYSAMTAEQRQSALREYWRRRFDNADITSVSDAFDRDKREMTFTMDGRLHMDFSRYNYRDDELSIGYRADFSRDAGPNSDAPFATEFPLFSQTSETILLPTGQNVFRLNDGDDVDQTVAGIAYHRHVTLSGPTFAGETSVRSVAAEFPASEAAAAQATLRDMYQHSVSFSTTSYHFTTADVAAQTASPPTDAAGFLRRGGIYLDARRYDEALADFEHAVALDPHNANALAVRGLAHSWKGETAAATRDLDAAAAIDPNNLIVFRARGVLAQSRGAYADAIVAYTRVLAISPTDFFSLGHRAEANHSAGNEDAALTDAGAAIAQHASWTDMYLLRANIYAARRDMAHVAAEADGLAAAAGEDVDGHVVAARIYGRAHQIDKAMHEFDRAIAIRPEGYIYLNRANTREKTDIAGRQADIDAALRLDPNDADTLAARASLLEDQHDYRGAVTVLNGALHTMPEDGQLLTQRGMDYERLGQHTQAEADFTTARAHAGPQALNTMCWTKVTENVALQSALADCDASLARSPNAANTMDSRALVLLRLGRNDEAIALYDQVLTLNPRLSTSLFGRGLAWQRKGDQAKADRDMAAAEQIDDNIRTRFEGYGLAPHANH